MTEIVKVCNVHGKLTVEKCYLFEKPHDKTKRRFVCSECVKFSQRKSRSRNNKAIVAREKSERDSLKDPYIKELLINLGFKFEDLNADIVSAYREIIKLKRKIGIIKKEKGRYVTPSQTIWKLTRNYTRNK